VLVAVVLEFRLANDDGVFELELLAIAVLHVLFYVELAQVRPHDRLEGLHVGALHQRRPQTLTVPIVLTQVK